MNSPLLLVNVPGGNSKALPLAAEGGKRDMQGDYLVDRNLIQKGGLVVTMIFDTKATKAQTRPPSKPVQCSNSFVNFCFSFVPFVLSDSASPQPAMPEMTLVFSASRRLCGIILNFPPLSAKPPHAC